MLNASTSAVCSIDRLQWGCRVDHPVCQLLQLIEDRREFQSACMPGGCSCWCKSNQNQIFSPHFDSFGAGLRWRRSDTLQGSEEGNVYTAWTEAPLRVCCVCQKAARYLSSVESTTAPPWKIATTAVPRLVDSRIVAASQI